MAEEKIRQVEECILICSVRLQEIGRMDKQHLAETNCRVAINGAMCGSTTRVAEWFCYAPLSYSLW